MPLTRTSLIALAALLAACSGGASVASESDAPAASVVTPVANSDAAPFQVEALGSFAAPWAAAFEPGTPNLFITEKDGTLRFVNTANGRMGTVTGVPRVDAGGQGGLGDIAFAPDYATSRVLYLTWVEAGPDDTRGAVLGRGTLACEEHDSCAIEGLTIIWRQQPKVTGRGHFSHRIAFSPDGRHLFLSSGDRQKMDPAQDLTGTLGKVLRLLPDGRPAPGNPFAKRGGAAAEIWSYGHRNLLGLAFAPDGTLWEHEMGPKGGDEINVIERGANYGWPRASNGSHYDDRAIPDHAAGDGFTAPRVWWNPSISPAGLVYYTGDLFPAWKGSLLLGALSGKALIRVATDGAGSNGAAAQARKADQWDMGARIREVEQGPDGALWLLEDGDSARLLKLTPRR